MKIKIAIFVFGLALGISVVLGLQSFYNTSYDIVIHHSNFLERVELARKYFGGSDNKEFEGHLLCDVAWSAKKVESYFDVHGLESKSLDLKGLKESYEVEYSNLMSSRGYDSKNFLNKMCDSIGRYIGREQ